MIGLAPMDGITDAAFRQVVDEVGKPDILFTEFVPVGGVVRGRPTVLNGLTKHSSKTPVIAQFFGSEPEFFYKAFFIAAERGFAGVDVNMGCPDTSIMKKGGGAALMLNPQRAKEILTTLKKARNDWHALHPKDTMTLSVKTRTGVTKPITTEWISHLLETNIDYICIHGRTAEEGYRGKADWGEVKKAVDLAKGSSTQIWGNGDVRSITEALQTKKETGVSGVLIGRAALGNPWLFADIIPSFRQRVDMMRCHASLFLAFCPDLDLKPMRKHLAWYCKGVEGSAKLREKLMKVVTMEDLSRVLEGAQELL